MFGEWGNPATRRLHPHHPPRARRRDQLHRHRRRVLAADDSRGDRRQGAGRRQARQRRAGHQGPRHDGRRPDQLGNSRRWIVREVRELAAASEHRLDRPLPDPPSRGRHRHRRDAGRADRPGRAGKVRYIGSSTFPPRASSRPSGRPSGADASDSCASSRRTRSWSERWRGRRFPPRARHGMGVIPWSPLAGGWLSGGYRTDAEAPQSRRGRAHSRAATTSPIPPTSASSEAADALGKLADEAGITLIEMALAFVIRHPAVTARDHRSADDGAPGVAADRGRCGAVRRRAESTSTRSSRHGRT